MGISPGHTAIYLLFAVQCLFAGSTLFLGYPERVRSYAKHLWVYLLFIAVAVKFSLHAASIILAIISFMALREYYSLIAIRTGDRLAIWGGFLAIPLMLLTHITNNPLIFITIGPVYAFLFIPLLVSFGNHNADGVLFSSTIIGFGLFVFVYGNGLFGFLALKNIWFAVIALVNVSLSDAIAFLLFSTQKRQFTGKFVQYLAAVPCTVTATLLVSDLTTLGYAQSILAGALTPMFVALIRYLMVHIESDLGTAQEYTSLRRGRLINSSCSLVLTSPILYYLILIFVE